MHFTLVTAVAVLAHTTQSFAAPIPASYEIQDLSARSDGKDNWKKAMQGIAGSIPDAALKVPVKGNVASVVQKAMAVAKAGSSSSSDTHHTPKLPATAPINAPAQPAPLTKKKSSLFQPPAPAPASSKKSKSIAEQAQDAKSIANQAAGAFHRPAKRDVIPDLKARSDPNDNWKKAMKGVAASIPDAALKVPVKSNMASVVQKAMAAAKAGSSPSNDTPHTPRLPAAAPINGPAQPAPLTKKKSSLFQPPVSAPAPSKKSESIAEQAQEAKSIANQAAGAFHRTAKRDIIPDLEARYLEIEELD